MSGNVADENKAVPVNRCIDDVTPEMEVMETDFEIPLDSINSARFQRSRIHSLQINSARNSPFFPGTADLDPCFRSTREDIPDIKKFEELNRSDEEKKIDESKDDFKAFEMWLLDHGAKFPSLYLKSYSENVRGVHAKVHIGSYERILYIPLNCIIHDKMGKDTEAGKIIFNPLNDAQLSTPNLNAVVVYILTTLEDNDHFFQPYYKILPLDYGSFPIFWPKEKLEWLNGSNLLREIEERLNLMKSDYLELCAVYPPFTKYSLEQFLKIRTAVGSRNFGITIDGEKRTAMVPFADMLNHYRPRQTSWTYENNQKGFTITSISQLYPGEQVMDSYGMKCNSKFFLHYGFAVENNREEYGKCHNEITTKLCCTTLSIQKLVLLEDLFSVQCKSTNEVEKVCKISMNFDSTSTSEALSFLRVKHATDDELRLKLGEKAGFYFSRRARTIAIEPLSIENELAVLKDLHDVFSAQLKKYDLSYEENKALLKSDKIKPFSDRRTALIMILSEQEICWFWKKTYLTLLPILEEQELSQLKELPIADFQQRDVSRYAAYLFTKLSIF